MFDATSRYSGIAIVSLKSPDSDGATVEIRYVKRRFIPSSKGATVLVKHRVTQDERLDNIAARYLSDPRQFWRICDANSVLRPEELTNSVGQVIEITMPQL